MLNGFVVHGECGWQTDGIAMASNNAHLSDTRRGRQVRVCDVSSNTDMFCGVEWTLTAHVGRYESHAVMTSANVNDKDSYSERSVMVSGTVGGRVRSAALRILQDNCTTTSGPPAGRPSSDSIHWAALCFKLTSLGPFYFILFSVC